jgi:hypothetical protein
MNGASAFMPGMRTFWSEYLQARDHLRDLKVILQCVLDK